MNHTPSPQDNKNHVISKIHTSKIPLGYKPSLKSVHKKSLRKRKSKHTYTNTKPKGTFERLLIFFGRNSGEWTISRKNDKTEKSKRTRQKNNNKRVDKKGNQITALKLQTGLEIKASLRGTIKNIVQELCESRGGRPGLSVLTSLLASVDVDLLNRASALVTTCP